jgi:hypothetical protein
VQVPSLKPQSAFGFQNKDTGNNLSSHGGKLDLSVGEPGDENFTGTGINKDSVTAAHGELHLLAASMSEKATLSMLRDLWGNFNLQRNGHLISSLV